MTGHCHCRPGCLSPLRKADVTVQTVAGPVLPVHLHPTSAYPVEHLTSLVSPLSVVGVK